MKNRQPVNSVLIFLPLHGLIVGSDHDSQDSLDKKNNKRPQGLEHVEHVCHSTRAWFATLNVGISNRERERDARQRCSGAEASCKAVFVEPVTGPRTRERAVPPALCRAGVELHEAALGTHGVGGEHWVRVGIAAEEVLWGGREERVERREEVAVFLRRQALEIVHPVCAVPGKRGG